MKVMRAVPIVLLLALVGCDDGGSRGSGISAELSGNVASVETSGGAGGVGDLPVAIEGSRLGARTDAQGNFSLSGDFEGVVFLVFSSTDGGATARIGVNMPGAGAISLHDVHIDFPRGQASAAMQTVDFDGIIAAYDCPGQLLSLISAAGEPGRGETYTVRLDTSRLEDAHGQPLPCEMLSAGQRVRVRGNVNADGTFGDALIEILPETQG